MTLPQTPDTIFSPTAQQDYDHLLATFEAAGLDLQPLRSHILKKGVLFERAYKEISDNPELWEKLSAHEKRVASQLLVYVRNQRLSYRRNEPLVVEYGPDRRIAAARASRKKAGRVSLKVRINVLEATAEFLKKKLLRSWAV